MLTKARLCIWLKGVAALEIMLTLCGRGRLLKKFAATSIKQLVIRCQAFFRIKMLLKIVIIQCFIISNITISRLLVLTNYTCLDLIFTWIHICNWILQLKNSCFFFFIIHISFHDFHAGWEFSQHYWNTSYATALNNVRTRDDLTKLN